MAKFKHAGNGNFIRISTDGNGNELPETKTAPFGPNDKPGTMGAGFFAEKEAWVEAGGVVEDQFTATEQTAKDQAEAEQALDSQKSTCLQLLRESDYKSLSDWPYPAADKTQWKNFRTALRIIINSDQMETIPDKPF